MLGSRGGVDPVGEREGHSLLIGPRRGSRNRGSWIGSALDFLSRRGDQGMKGERCYSADQESAAGPSSEEEEMMKAKEEGI